MPTYSYSCPACGTFDYRHGFSERLEVCPTCGSDEVRKVFLPVPILFKGSGFYVTDNRKPDPSASTESPPAKAPEPAKAKAS